VNEAIATGVIEAVAADDPALPNTETDRAAKTATSMPIHPVAVIETVSVKIATRAVTAGAPNAIGNGIAIGAQVELREDETTMMVADVGTEATAATWTTVGREPVGAIESKRGNAGAARHLLPRSGNPRQI